MVAYMSESSDSADDGACTVLTPGREETPAALMGYSVAVDRAKAKAKAQPTSAPAVAPKGGVSSSSGRPAYQGPVSEHLLPKPKSKSIAKKNPPNPPRAQKHLSALILYDKVALHIPSRKLAVTVAIQLLKEEKTSGNIRSRTALTNK